MISARKIVVRHNDRGVGRAAVGCFRRAAAGRDVRHDGRTDQGGDRTGLPYNDRHCTLWDADGQIPRGYLLRRYLLYCYPYCAPLVSDNE